MTIKEQLERIYKYGRDPYYQEIQKMPSYQNELARVQKDFNERSWINPISIIPKFTTSDFDKRRASYQSKHGNTVNLPGFNDIIHIIPKAKISAREMAAHRWAEKRKLPSPLSVDQLKTLTYKKARFLKALASPTPTWMKNVGAVANVLDNVEDALITLGVIGRLALRRSIRTGGKIGSSVGWLYLGSDIINLFNILSWVTFASSGAKRKLEKATDRNPFHHKAKANRASKLKRSFPTFGEWLEIAQTTDQLFGVGLCLGGIMGMATDVVDRGYYYSTAILKAYLSADLPRSGIGDVLFKELPTDVEKFFKQVTKPYTWPVNENRYDEILRTLDPDTIWNAAKNNQAIDIAKAKVRPSDIIKNFGRTLWSTMIAATNLTGLLKEDQDALFLTSNIATQGMFEWWGGVDTLDSIKDIRGFKFGIPEPRDPATISILEEGVHDWKITLQWPFLDQRYATAEEIAYGYAPRIKEEFQEYSLTRQYDYAAMINAENAVETIDNTIAMLSDDGQVRVSRSAFVEVVLDMIRNLYLFPPDTPSYKIEQFGSWVSWYERTYGGPPNIRLVIKQGEILGIEWMRSFPRRAFNEAAKLFPEWQAIQDQLADLYVAD